MRSSVLALLALVACEGGKSPPPVPLYCERHCVVQHPVVTAEDCCGPITCYPDDGEWRVAYCSPEPITECSCGPDEVCVQLFDGVCGSGVPQCVPKTIDCPAQGSCSQECQDTYCREPYQCHTRSTCGTELPGAFACYGH